MNNFAAIRHRPYVCMVRHQQLQNSAKEGIKVLYAI